MLVTTVTNLTYTFMGQRHNVLPPKPAKIPPFDLKVDESQWSVSKNRTPPRLQSTANQIDIVKQKTELEKAGIIEKSQSPYYSQVLMIPKPDGSERICIDYRNLNDCNTDALWPIIAEMLRRIGNQKPKNFGTMDLTQGYHQALITINTRAYTSFFLFSGIYQFTGLPFVPKRAPSYFQQVMATVELAGLMYFGTTVVNATTVKRFSKMKFNLYGNENEKRNNEIKTQNSKTIDQTNGAGCATTE